MPSTYTSSNRFEKPGLFEQDSTWGGTANTDFDLIDQAISGALSIALPDSNYSLTANNGATDQSRNMVLAFTGTLTATRTITIPTTSKTYMVTNSTNQSLIFSRGSGTTGTIAAAAQSILINDGTNIYLMASNAATLNGQAAAFYLNASNLNAGTVPVAQLPLATTSVVGAVQLTNSTSSTSTTTAAVPASVKSAFDLATTANTTANAASTASASAVTTATTASITAAAAQGTANTASTNASNAVSTANTAQGTANTALANANNAQSGVNTINSSYSLAMQTVAPGLRQYIATYYTNGTITLPAGGAWFYYILVFNGSGVVQGSPGTSNCSTAAGGTTIFTTGGGNIAVCFAIRLS